MERSRTAGMVGLQDLKPCRRPIQPPSRIISQPSQRAYPETHQKETLLRLALARVLGLMALRATRDRILSQIVRLTPSQTDPTFPSQPMAPLSDSASREGMSVVTVRIRANLALEIPGNLESHAKAVTHGSLEMLVTTGKPESRVILETLANLILRDRIDHATSRTGEILIKPATQQRGQMCLLAATSMNGTDRAIVGADELMNRPTGDLTNPPLLLRRRPQALMLWSRL